MSQKYILDPGAHQATLLLAHLSIELPIFCLLATDSGFCRCRQGSCQVRGRDISTKFVGYIIQLITNA